MKAFKVRKWLAGLFACTMAVALVPAGGTLAEGETWSTLLMKDAVSQKITMAQGTSSDPWVSVKELGGAYVPPFELGETNRAYAQFESVNVLGEIAVTGVWTTEAEDSWSVQVSVSGKDGWTDVAMENSALDEDNTLTGAAKKRTMKSAYMPLAGARYVRVWREKGGALDPALLSVTMTADPGTPELEEIPFENAATYITNAAGQLVEGEWGTRSWGGYEGHICNTSKDGNGEAVFRMESVFDSFKIMAMTYHYEIGKSNSYALSNTLKIQASTDGNAWEDVAATYEDKDADWEYEGSVSADGLKNKGYKYLKIIRDTSGNNDDAIPVITHVYMTGDSPTPAKTATVPEGESYTVLERDTLIERPWVKSDLADTYRPTNEENGDNDRYAEVVFNAGRVVNQLYMTYSWWPDSPDFVIKASVDGQNWETVSMQDYSTLKEDIGHAGLFKLRAAYSEDLTGKKYQWVKIERPGGGYAPGLGNLLVTTDGVDTEVPMVDVTSYAPLTPEEGETVFTDSLDAYVNDKGLGNAVYAQGLFFNQSVVVHREYLHLNRSCASVQGGTEGRMIYRQDGMTRFKYSYVTAKSLEAKLNAYVSPDGFTWTPAEVTAVRDESLAASEDFQRFDATASTVPAGTRYLLLEFADTANAQSYLGMVSIAGKGEGQGLAPTPSGEEQLLTDTFEGEDDAFSPLVSDCAGLVKKDVSEVRAGAPVLAREDIVDDAYVIYKADALKWMAVETSIDHEAEEDDDQTLAFTYFVSKDGQEWIELTDYSRLMSRAADPTAAYGTIAYAALPEGTRYLKIAAPEVDNIPDSVRLMTVQLLYEQAEQPPVSEPSSDPVSDDQSRGEEPGSDASTPDTGDARTGLLAAGGLAALCAGALLTLKKRTVRGK